MSERLGILKLLEEGKINAEEAARLLEALNHGKERRRGHGLWTSLETIPDMVQTMLAHGFKHGSGEEALRFDARPNIVFKGISGDLAVTGTNGGGVTIQKDGFARIEETGDTLTVKAISGDIALTVPRETNLELRGVSGDVAIKDIAGRIVFDAVSGDITGAGLAGDFTAESSCADIDLALVRIGHVDIVTQSGDIAIHLPGDSSFSLEAVSEHGAIECEFELSDRRADQHSLRGKAGSGNGRLRVATAIGDIAILRTS